MPGTIIGILWSGKEDLLEKYFVKVIEGDQEEASKKCRK
jgi:hypothetical protein